MTQDAWIVQAQGTQDARGACTIHATCVVLQEAGVLIRGEAGAGKSTLALALLDRAAQSGLHGCLVGDDRISIERHHGRLVAYPHPALGGLIEVRGLGIRSATSTLDAGVVRLVVELVEAVPRLPKAGLDEVDLLGIRLPRLTLDRRMLATGLAPALIVDWLISAECVAARTHTTILAPAAPPNV